MADIATWLDSLGLAEHEAAFRENGVDLALLPELSNDDLKDLGVARLADRKRLLKAIAALGGAAGEPSSVAEEPMAGRSAEAERRQLTVMFSDLVGSTALSRRLDPEDLRELMRRYQDAVSGAVTHYGGHIAKYLGDGVLAYFGWPQAYEDQAERAVRSGLEAVAAVAGLRLDDGGELAARVGIATGQVVVGDLVGEGGRDADAVTGETPNLAARLQATAAPGEVIVGAATRGLLGQAFQLDDLGAQDLKGFDAAVPAWRVVGERALESRFEASHGAALTRFVGRQSELGLLLERWELAKDGEGQVVLIAGEAGIGKSRLTEALQESIAGETYFRVHLQASPHHTNTPLYGAIQNLQRAAGFAAADDATTRLDKLQAWLERGGKVDGEIRALYADLLGLPYAERWGALDLTPEEQKRRTYDALIEHFLSLARQRPLLAIFEDAHWTDPTAQELIEMHVGKIRNLANLIVITHRPEWQAPFRNQAHVTTLQLSGLGRAQGAEIVRAIAGDEVGDDIVRRIVERTDGIPLFVEELTKSVVESGLDIAATEIPATLQASLLARLDRLGPEAKEVAQIGAVIGREFTYDLLQAAGRRPERELNGSLRRMVHAELVFQQGISPEAQYSFKHALVQDVAYESLLKSRRQKLHLRIAEALTERFVETVEVEPELLAHHYTEAGRTDQAIDHWQKAGERALRRSANVEAINHLRKGLELLEGLPETRERHRRELSVQLTLGPALMAVKGQGASEARQAYARARELGQRLGDTRQHFRALWGSWRSHFIQSEHSAARTLGEQCLSLAEESQDIALILGARFAFAGSLVLMGDFSPARVHLERTVPLYDAEKHRSLAFEFGQDPGASMLSYLSWTLWHLGFPERAIEKGREALALAEALGHPLTLAQVLNYFAMTHCLCRDWRAARERAETNMKLSNERGFPQTFWLASSIQARTLVEEGRADDNIPQFEEAVAARKAIGVRAGRLLELALLAEAYGEANQIDKGLRVLDEAIDFANRTGEGFYAPELHRLKGTFLMLGDRPDAAAEASVCFREGMDLAKMQKAKSLELRAATSLARLWRDQGETSEARTLLTPVYGWFTEGFETPDLRDAEALLKALA